jgi:hypothetical protein
MLPGPIGAGIAGTAAAGEEAVKQFRKKIDTGAAMDPMGIAKKGAAVGALTFGGGKLAEGLGKVGGIFTGSTRAKALAKAAEEYATAAKAGKRINPEQLFKGLDDIEKQFDSKGASQIIKKLKDYVARKVPVPTTPPPFGKPLVTVPSISNKVAEAAAEVPNRLSPTAVYKIQQKLEKLAVSKTAKGEAAKLMAENARQALAKIAPAGAAADRAAAQAVTASKVLAPKNILGRTLPGALIGATVGHGGMLGGPMGAALELAMTHPAVQHAIGSGLESPYLQMLLQQAGQGPRFMDTQP